jgi:putative DNA primase/helicase
MITAPIGLALKRGNVPRELKELDQWVGWRWKQIGEKWTKVPYDLKTGKAAASDDPTTWAPYSKTEGHRNIGFMFGDDDAFCGIDLDECRNPETGEITKQARQIIDQMASYSEISPSGTGVKIFIKGVVPGLRRKNPKKKIEVYDRGRFFACTGHHLPSTPKTIEPRQKELKTFYWRLFPLKEEPSPTTNGNLSRAAGFAVNHDLSDEDILSRAYRAANGDRFMKLWNGDASDYQSHSEGDLALCAMLAFWTGPDPERIERMVSESKLSERPKWRERPRYRRDTVAKALDRMTDFYDQATGAALVVSKSGDPSENGVVLPNFPPPLPEGPPFPTDALPEVARRFVEEGGEAIGCAADLLALPALAVLSAGIGASRVVEIKRSWREGATLFLAVVASPGEKKTPAANAARRPLLKRQAEKRQEFKAKKEEHEREMREWKAHCRDARSAGQTEPPRPPEPTMERTYADDTTVESLVGILEDNPRGVLIYKDELTGWVRSHDQYRAAGKGADRQHWLSMWSNQAIVVDRKSRQGDPTYVERPWVSLVGGIQPAMLPELGGSMEDGLLDRFLFCYPKHSHTDLSDVEIGADTEAKYAGLYEKLSSLRMVEDEIGQEAPNVVPMSREAGRLFKEIHDQIGRETLEPGFPLRLQGVWAKMRGYLARISLVLALCRCVEHGEPEQVEEEDVKNAARIVGYFKAHARRVYRELQMTTPEDLLAGEIKDLLQNHDGKWSGSATELYDELVEREARGLPENADWLSRVALSIGDRSELLTVEKKRTGEKRLLKLTLKNSVTGVIGVTRREAGSDASDTNDANPKEIKWID